MFLLTTAPFTHSLWDSAIWRDVAVSRVWGSRFCFSFSLGLLSICVSPPRLLSGQQDVLPLWFYVITGWVFVMLSSSHLNKRQGPPRRLKHNIIKNSSENIYHGDSLANTGLSWACGCCAHRGFLPCLPFLLTTPRHEYTTSRGMEAAAPWHSQPIQKEMTLWESTITAKIPKPLFWDSSYICC